MFQRRCVPAFAGHERMLTAFAMIVLFTDFGLQGPYTGQMKAVLHQMAPGIGAIDLFADAPAGNPKAPPYLLAADAQLCVGVPTLLSGGSPGVGGLTAPGSL